jgi:outer membrane protein TolC
MAYHACPVCCRAFIEGSAMRCDILAAMALCACCVTAHGCRSPLAEGGAADLRRMVLASAQATLPADQAPGADDADWLSEPESVYADDVRRELDARTDPRRHADATPDLGPGLDRADARRVPMTLNQALVIAARHNLDVKLARVIPLIRREQVIEAEAEFDWAAFGSASVGQDDQPIPASTLNGVPVGSNATIRHNARLESGIRKRIQRLGGTIRVSAGADYINDQSPGLSFAPDPAWTANLALAVSQPLLRDFGAQVNGARIRLAANARDRDVLAVNGQLLRTSAETEAAYWELVFTHYRLVIEEQLLATTSRTRDEVAARRDVDANPVQLARARSELRSRRIEVIRARAAVRRASDRLKRLLNAPDLPVAGEAVVQPLDYPCELPEFHDLRAAVTDAVRHRPDLAQILLEVDDARIRMDVARNQRLPRLDLTGEVRHYGLDDELGESYEASGDDFVEYLVGLEFEQPIGNRAADAAVHRTRLARQAQSIRYRGAVRDVIIEVKDSLRRMQTSYRVLRVARDGRRAAAENLRALTEREKTGQELTPEFLLDLKLRTQQRLAQAEIDEVRATVDYNIARARFYQAIGRLPAEHRVPPEPARRDDHDPPRETP